MTRQTYDQIIRELRNDQALESRNKLKDFQSITKARMKAMDKRRGQSTRFSATDSSSSLGYGPGDDDDDDDDEDGGGGVGGDEGDVEEEEEEEGADEDAEEGATSFPAAPLDALGARGPLSPLFLAASGSDYPLFEPLAPPSRGAPKPKARNLLSFPWNWLSGAPQASPEASVASAPKRPELKQRKKQPPGRLDVPPNQPNVLLSQNH